MGDRIQALAQQFLNKASVAECSLDEIKHLVQRHPYFAPAQFLLLQKLRETDAPEAEAQTRKAILYYHDPLQFDFFISSRNFSSAALFTESSDYHQTPAFTPGDVSEELIDEKSSLAVVTPVENADTPMKGLDEINTNQETDAYINSDASGKDVAIAEENYQPLIEDGVPDDKISDLSLPGENDIITTRQLSTATEAQTESDSGTAIGVPVLQAGTDVKELSFEPFHTVDYFASQGIKIPADELGKDKLGKQLKSFTDWLRTMKRLPTTQSGTGVATVAEQTIEKMADTSVTDPHIVTEAMAEVWMKQGNTAKAVETYNKLSLLYPSKKAFFAGKIETLKHL